MGERAPGIKFLFWSVLCLACTAYLVSVTANIDKIPFVSERESYSAVLTDVSGLFPGDDVRVSGVSVGRVTSIQPKKGKALVTFEVKPDVEITDTWEVGVQWRNVLGQRFFYLFEAPGGQKLEPGSRIPVGRSRPVANIGRFFNQITPLLEAIDPQEQNKVVNAMVEALGGQEKRVQELISDFGSLSDKLADQGPSIRRVLDNGSRILAELNERDEQLRGAIDDLAAIGDTVRARNDELIGAITEIGEVQQRFGDLIAANDEEISGSIDNLDAIFADIAAQRDEFDQVLGNLREGGAFYMIISRDGQWFNVRFTAFQAQTSDGEVLTCRTESNAECYVPNSSAPSSDASDGSIDDEEGGTRNTDGSDGSGGSDGSDGSGGSDGSDGGPLSPPQLGSATLQRAPTRRPGLQVVTQEATGPSEQAPLTADLAAAAGSAGGEG
jgi:phospholipid/cholesterol/gamma-HCH transport system substrate-binding protein